MKLKKEDKLDNKEKEGGECENSFFTPVTFFADIHPLIPFFSLTLISFRLRFEYKTGLKTFP